MPLPGSEREVVLWGFIGAPNSGKSHQQKIVAEKLGRDRILVIPDGRDDKMWNKLTELKSIQGFKLDPRDYRGKRQLPVLHYPTIRSYKGARVIYNDTPGKSSDTMKAVLDPVSGYRDGILILDDIRNHIPSTKEIPAWANAFLGSRRKLMVDIMFAGWAMEDVNRQIYALNPRLFIFNLAAPPTLTTLEKNFDRERLLRTIEFVRDRNAKLPEGQKRFFWPFDPLDPSYYPVPVNGARSDAASSAQ